MKILFINNGYTLKNTSSAIRNNALVSGLISNGHDVNVYTIRFPSERTSHYLNKGNIFFTDMPGIIANKKINDAIVKYEWLMKFKVKLHAFICFPDAYYKWPKLLKVNNIQQYDIMISSSDNKISHFAAHKIKKQNPELNWLQIWGDPWYDDINSNWLLKRRIYRNEKKLLHSCEYIVYISQLTCDLIKNRFPNLKDKIFYIPRSYFMEVKKINNNSGKFHIVYSGALNFGRRIDNFLNAIKYYNDSTDKNNQIILDFYGSYAQNILKILTYYNFVKIHGTVDYDIMLQVYSSADALLFIANKEGTTQIPGKLYDYFGTSCKIICLVNDINDLIAKYLNNYNDKCIVIKNDLSSIKNNLAYLKKMIKTDSPIIQDFSPMIIAKRIIDITKN